MCKLNKAGVEGFIKYLRFLSPSGGISEKSAALESLKKKFMQNRGEKSEKKIKNHTIEKSLFGNKGMRGNWEEKLMSEYCKCNLLSHMGEKGKKKKRVRASSRPMNEKSILDFLFLTHSWQTKQTKEEKKSKQECERETLEGVKLRKS